MLKGKNVIITGCNRGIGRAMVEAFAAAGANIYAHARKATPEFLAQLTTTAQKAGVEIWPLFFDLTNYDDMKAAIKQMVAAKRPVDALVNNAGITYNALFQMSTEENLRDQFEVNFFSIFILTQYVSKLMVRQKGGSIVNIASTAGLDGNSGKSVYGASKAAVISMTQSIAEELGSAGVRANCIAPGITETDMIASMPDNVVAQTISSTSLGRVSAPGNIADTAVFLASDASSYITGQVIRVDGGM